MPSPHPSVVRPLVSVEPAPPPVVHSGHDAVPRWVNIALGGWLLITPFLWPHTERTAGNALVVGALIAAVAIWAMYRPRIRYANTAFALWLVVATFVFEHVSAATVWNNLVVAVAVFIASLLPVDRRVNRSPSSAAVTSNV